MCGSVVAAETEVSTGKDTSVVYTCPTAKLLQNAQNQINMATCCTPPCTKSETNCNNADKITRQIVRKQNAIFNI